MGPVAFFSLCLLGCLIFNPSLEATPRRVSALRTGLGINTTAHCHRGWFHYRDHCFKFFSEQLTWLDAETQCQYDRTRAHLASILNDAERGAVANYLGTLTSTDHVWIGLHNPSKGKTWVWSDGSLFRYKAWNIGEPNNALGNEFCVQLLAHTGYKNWNDAPCEWKHPYLCKYGL
ncbi:C-type lectin BfL-2-like isoform X2 [Pelodiscus sinensis]|uniref:C-type lectin BfL-2-like isoform X2 n=1 Tax=Pelodiscus sinensis TaxID=13735 RepID=UPI003F6CAD0C